MIFFQVAGSLSHKSSIDMQIIQDYASSGGPARRALQMAASMVVTRSTEQQQPYPGSSPPISSGKTAHRPSWDTIFTEGNMQSLI